MSRFTVRPYESGDEESLLALFNAVFGEGNPAWVPRTMDTWRHIFLANPYGVEITVAVDADGQVIANYSGIPAELWVKGELRPCVQGVDTAVHADWRGLFGEKSVYRQVTAAFTDRWCKTGSDFYSEILYGVPNRQAFAAGSRVIGYKAVHRPLIRTVKEFEPEWIDALDARADGVVAAESDWSDLGEMAALFDAHRDEIPMALDRSEPYMAWRYRDWPGRPYRALAARRNGALVGAMFFRLGWLGHPIVPLVEWIGPGADRAAVAALLAGVARITHAAGGRRLETWLTLDTPHHVSARSLGMEDEESPFMTALAIYSADIDLQFIKDNWWITMGQFDLH